LAAKVVTKIQSTVAHVATVITALGGDNAPLATLDIRANAVSDVSFMISSVADSVYQAGSFETLFSSGKLRSPLISIRPNTIVDTRSGGVSLTLPVYVPVDQCFDATKNMKVRDASRAPTCAN
jgi:hypothetical protein